MGFAVGLPRKRCYHDGCKCLCETAAKPDGTCKQVYTSGYDLYRYKASASAAPAKETGWKKKANHKCDPAVWSGKADTLEDCKKRCAGKKYMSYARGGDRNCACQDWCGKQKYASVCDFYENVDYASVAVGSSETSIGSNILVFGAFAVMA